MEVRVRRGARSARIRHPALEAMEARQLLSVTMFPAMGATKPLVPAIRLLQTPGQGGGGGSDRGGNGAPSGGGGRGITPRDAGRGPVVRPGVDRLQQFPPVFQGQTPSLTGGALGGPALTTGNDPFPIASGTIDGIPTPHELARNRLFGRFNGHFDRAAGRTNELAATTRLDGVGSYTDILHADALGVLGTPVAGSNLPAAGIVELNPRNVGVTGQLILRVQAAPGDTSRPAPGHYTWVVDPSSGGGYTNSLGQGTLDIHFVPTRRHLGAPAGGNFSMVIRGQLITSGLGF
ncbi:MAG: hypothetical protein ACM35G_01970 [Planctomycetaceae bacterium]